MTKIIALVELLVLVFAGAVNAQGQQPEIKGQFSSYLNINPENDFDLYLGSNFIPEVTWGKGMGEQLFDLKLSANIRGNVSHTLGEESNVDGDVDPYRFWMRYSGNQFELRLGLQKINFGSASNLRPLRWFDQVDPRDPLAITNGVWGMLGRYYFLNNANIWVWGLYGNNQTKGWELMENRDQFPELGGRVQVPVPQGELAATYHHRKIDARTFSQPIFSFSSVDEHRFGLDGKWDIMVGFWIEASHSFRNKELDVFTHQTLLTVGTDYTFAIGNGPSVVLEHMLISYDKSAFEFDDPQQLTAISGSYPVSFFDQISTVFFYDWEANNLLSYLNYQRDLKNFTLYTMLYLNPTDQGDIQLNNSTNLFSGKGIQVMMVYNF